jgi:hypothetical protein
MFSDECNNALSIIKLYEDLLSLAFPFIMIITTAATYQIIIDSTAHAYNGLNKDISAMGDSILTAMNESIEEI